MPKHVQLIAVLNDLVRAPISEGDAAIAIALARICDHARIDRAFLFQRLASGLFSCSHQSHPDSPDPVTPRSGGLSADLLARLEADQPVCVPDMAGIAGQAPETTLLQLQGIGSMLIIPMRQGAQLAGFICYGMTGKPHANAGAQIGLLTSATNLVESVLIRSAAEKQTIRAADRLEATLAALPDLLFEVDADGCYTGFTAGPEILMAEPSAALAGRSMDSVLPPDVAAIAKAALREVYATGSVRDVHYRLDLGDGQHVFEMSGALRPSGDLHDRPSAIFLVRDVTKDAQVRDELSRLGKIVEVMDNLVVIMDPERCVVWVNAAFEKQTGWRLDEIRGKRLGELVRCPESDPVVIAQVNAAITERRAFRGEMANQDRHGIKYWVDFNILPLLDANGQLQGYVSVETVVTTLHAQKVAIEQLAVTAAAAQARLENAIMALPDGVVIIDADERVIAVNRAYHQTFPELADLAVPGVLLSDLLRAGISKGVYSTPASGGDQEKRLQERLAEYRKPQSTDELQLPDGRWLRRINMRTADGGCIAVGIDITARHNHLAALDAMNLELTAALEDRDATKQRLVGILDGAEVGTWERDIANDSLQVGGHWGEIIGLETKALTDLRTADFRALVHEDDLRIMLDEERPTDFRPGINIIESEFRMRHRDGRWVWVLSRGRVTSRAADGAPLRMSGVHLDIDERKRLERDLSANRAYVTQIMDTSVSAVAVLDGEGVVAFANREAEYVLGLERSEIIGRTYADPAWRLERVAGGPLPDEERPFRRAMAAGGPVRDVQIALHWPDGTRRILSCNAVPMLSENSHGQVVSSFSDITEQLAVTARLQEAVARAEEMSRAKSVFLANMSHEIRTPLNGVLGMAEVLAVLLTEPGQKRMIETIRKSGETLLTVLNGILDMSKIEAGKMVLDLVPFSPLDMVRQVETIYAVQAEEKGVEFEVLSSAGSETPRLGDLHRIQQILNNLLSNAIKFTERGGVTLKLACRAGKPLVIEVSDTGIGMDQHQVGRVFENFEQADSSTTRRFGGTGLGLSIVKQLVALMGGEITLDSAPGHGTRIKISLPLPEADVAAAGATGAADEILNGASLAGVRLLCADDNPINRLVLKEMLLPTGALMTEVENGQQAIDIWASGLASGEPFALLLLDITMPVRDGMSALAEIRAAEAARGLPPVPAIAVTANAMPHQVADYIVGGFDTHLAKPFKQRDLLHALHSLL